MEQSSGRLASVVATSNPFEVELDGLKVVVAVLERLRTDERTRVMRYLVDRYGPSAAREAMS